MSNKNFTHPSPDNITQYSDLPKVETLLEASRTSSERCLFLNGAFLPHLSLQVNAAAIPLKTTDSESTCCKRTGRKKEEHVILSQLFFASALPPPQVPQEENQQERPEGLGLSCSDKLWDSADALTFSFQPLSFRNQRSIFRQFRFGKTASASPEHMFAVIS